MYGSHVAGGSGIAAHIVSVLVARAVGGAVDVVVVEADGSVFGMSA